MKHLYHNYVVKLYLEARDQVAGAYDVDQVVQVSDNIHPVGVPLYAFPRATGVRLGFLFSADSPQDGLITYLASQHERDPMWLAFGGLAFLDEGSGQILSTNWDFGETEQWFSILDSVRTSGRVLHTFSATDSAVEVTLRDEQVLIQFLDWELRDEDGYPGGRLTEPIHVFPNWKRFETEVAALLHWYEQLKQRARGSSLAVRQFLSVQARVAHGQSGLSPTND